MKTQRIAVITASIGGIDVQKFMPQQSIECDYFYFNDRNCPYTFHGLDNRLKAKYFKIRAHRMEMFSGYDILVWVDGNIQVHRPDFIETVIAPLNNPNIDIAISRHPSRNCIYEEANFIIDEIKKGNKYLSTRYTVESMQAEIFNFHSSRHPENAGLYWCGLFARKNDVKLDDFCEDWWEDNILWTNFDQNNFVFQARRHNIQIGTFDLGNFYENQYYKLIHHSKLM